MGDSRLDPAATMILKNFESHLLGFGGGIWTGGSNPSERAEKGNRILRAIPVDLRQNHGVDQGGTERQDRNQPYTTTSPGTSGTNKGLNTRDRVPRNNDGTTALPAHPVLMSAHRCRHGIIMMHPAWRASVAGAADKCGGSDSNKREEKGGNFHGFPFYRSEIAKAS